MTHLRKTRPTNLSLNGSALSSVCSENFYRQISRKTNHLFRLINAIQVAPAPWLISSIVLKCHVRPSYRQWLMMAEIPKSSSTSQLRNTSGFLQFEGLPLNLTNRKGFVHLYEQAYTYMYSLYTSSYIPDVLWIRHTKGSETDSLCVPKYKNEIKIIFALQSIVKIYLTS